MSGDSATATRQSDRHALSLAAIVGGALVLRVVYVLAVKKGDLPRGDEIYYSTQARVLAEGGWFDHAFFGGPAADHPPLTQILLVPASFGEEPVLAQRLLMAVFGAAAVAAVGLLAARVVSRRAGLIAAALAAVYANVWMNDGLLMADTLSTLWITGLLLAVYAYLDRASARRAAIVGLLVGVGALTRAEILLVIPFVVVPVMLLTRFGAPPAPRERWRHLGVAIGITLASLAPWTIYNATRFDRPVLISTNDGLTLFGANCPDTYYGEGLGFWSLQCVLDHPVGDDDDPSVKSEAYRQAAMEYAGDHAGRWPVVIAARELRTWSLWRVDQMAYANTGEGREHWVSWIGVIQYWLLVPFAVAGAVVLRRRRVRLLPLLAMPALVVLVSAAFYGIPRFRIPAEITIVVLAAATFDHLLTMSARLRARPTREQAPSSAPVHASTPPDACA